uniref:Uncharacterized protein n=1 Tax=Oryza glumipatula TaxID=40148 RepID=A0A0D9Z7Z6_9ORYZ
MELFARGETITATGAARRQDGVAGEEEGSARMGRPGGGEETFLVAAATASDEGGGGAPTEEGACELALGWRPRAASTLSWVTRKRRRRGCVGRRRRWIGRCELNAGRGRVGTGKRARSRWGRRGAAAASAALPLEQEAKEWRQGARYPGREKAKGGGKGALLLPFWEERDENEPRLTVLDARGMGRRAREDDAGDDCKKDGDGLKVSTDTVVVRASDDRGERERERERALSLAQSACGARAGGGGRKRERRVGPGKEESAQNIDGGIIDCYPENFFKEYEEHLTLDLNSNWIFELNKIWRNQGGDSKSEFDTFGNGKEFR